MTLAQAEVLALSTLKQVMEEKVGGSCAPAHGRRASASACLRWVLLSGGKSLTRGVRLKLPPQLATRTSRRRGGAREAAG
jgi:hypothetical protein